MPPGSIARPSWRCDLAVAEDEDPTHRCGMAWQPVTARFDGHWRQIYRCNVGPVLMPHEPRDSRCVAPASVAWVPVPAGGWRCAPGVLGAEGHFVHQLAAAVLGHVDLGPCDAARADADHRNPVHAHQTDFEVAAGLGALRMRSRWREFPPERAPLVPFTRPASSLVSFRASDGSCALKDMPNPCDGVLAEHWPGVARTDSLVGEAVVARCRSAAGARSSGPGIAAGPPLMLGIIRPPQPLAEAHPPCRHSPR